MLMLAPPLLEQDVGSVQFSKDFPVQSQGSDFADGLMACTCPDCKTQTGLEVLKAALLFSNCLDSTRLRNMIFRGVSEATLKEPGV